MGDEYEWTDKCPVCRTEIDCYYAKASEVTTVTCKKCNTTFDIILNFVLRVKEDDQETG